MIDIWRIQQSIGLSIGAIAIGYSLMRRFGFPAAALFSYCLINAVLTFQVPWNSWGQAQIFVDSKSAIAFATVAMLVSTVALICRREIYLLLFAVFEIGLTLNALAVALTGYGIFTGASFNSSITAVVAVTMLFRRGKSSLNPAVRTIAIGICLVSILIVNGSTAYFVLAAGTAGAIISAHWARLGSKTRLAVGLVSSTIPIGIGYLATGKTQFLNSWDRFTEWPKFMRFWIEKADLAFGTGLGSFEILGPAIQQANGNRHLFLFMHNDWLQIIFELGIVGAILTATVCTQAVWRARQTPWLIGAMSAVAMAMTTQFPLRFFASQFLIVLLLAIALNEESHEAL